MDTKLHTLPPMKRFRLLQQENQPQPELPEPEKHHLLLPSSHLPAKKRKQSQDPPTKQCQDPPTNLSTTYSLPAKKRIWAIPPPNFSPIKSSSSLSSLDLNLEYIPSPDPIEETIDEKQEEEEEEEEEEDGVVCAVCDSTDGDPSDPIVFCDGCDLMVHTTCYGNPLLKGVPEGDWFCSQCSSCSSGQRQPNNCCCLCPEVGGAMKPTNDGRWAHIVCAVLVPEVFFEDPEGRDGIDCSKVPKRRWGEVCYVCEGRKGCAIQCSEPKCPLAFHVTCGLKEDLCIELNEGRKNTRGGGIVAAFCKKHTQLWKKQQQTGKFKIVARDEDGR